MTKDLEGPFSVNCTKYRCNPFMTFILSDHQIVLKHIAKSLRIFYECLHHAIRVDLDGKNEKQGSVLNLKKIRIFEPNCYYGRYPDTGLYDPETKHQLEAFRIFKAKKISFSNICWNSSCFTVLE